MDSPVDIHWPSHLTIVGWRLNIFSRRRRVDKYSTTLRSIVGQAAFCFDLSQLPPHQGSEYKHYL